MSDLGLARPAIQRSTGSPSAASLPTPPKILSIKDLVGNVSEDWDPETGEVRFTSFYVFDSDDFAFYGNIAKPKENVTPEDINSTLAYIPDEQIYPQLPLGSTLTIVPEILADEADKLWIKRPNLDIYDAVQDSPNLLARLLDSEARIMEVLAKHPHPNIVRYHGVRVRRGRITGIVLDKLQCTLLHHIRQGRPIDKGAFIVALVSAVAHLHSIDLAHNDLNPENIMLDAQGMPVLIDFGSCQPCFR